MNNQSKRGGSRPGAGRPVSEATVQIRVPVGLLDAVKALIINYKAVDVVEPPSIVAPKIKRKSSRSKAVDVVEPPSIVAPKIKRKPIKAEQVDWVEPPSITAPKIKTASSDLDYVSSLPRKDRRMAIKRFGSLEAAARQFTLSKLDKSFTVGKKKPVKV